jgi:deazaflavin-dependent oxidoreductase (nitroreductase family)
MQARSGKWRWFMPERDRGSRNQQVIDEFRDNGGTVGGYFAGMSLLLLTTTGARSGQPHTVPLSYFADGGRYIVFAAAGGAPADPDWYHNLLADPRVTVEAGTGIFEATAAVTTGEERDALFERCAAVRPQLLVYQNRTTRQIPVAALTRREDR